MSDIRARLADALREHQPSDLGFCTAEGCNWRYWPGHDHVEHQSAVVLSLPGIAIVELPEPNSATGCWSISARRDLWVEDGEVVQILPKSSGMTHSYRSPNLVRKVAAALLAAAVQAQEEQP